MSTQRRKIEQSRLSEPKILDVEKTNISHESGFSSEGDLSFLREEEYATFLHQSFSKNVVQEKEFRESVTESDSLVDLSPSVLKPLYFEVPQSSAHSLTGRKWLFQDISDHLDSVKQISRGVIIEGGPGVGKTAAVLALVESSCFGTVEEIPKGTSLD